MRIIAIMNLKGGVGKTVTAVNVASILAAEHRKRVLLIDADSQCNTTEFFLHNEEPIGTLYDLLARDGYPAFCTTHTDLVDLDLIPAVDALMALDLKAAEGKKAKLTALRAALADLEAADRYDVAIIDCPPSFSVACAAALLAAREVIIPIKLDAFSLRGMTNLYKQVASMQRLNPELRVAGCLETMWYSDPRMEQADKQLRASNLPVFTTRIRRSDRVDGSTFAQEPLRRYSPHSAAGVDYRRFVAELIGGARRGK